MKLPFPKAMVLAAGLGTRMRPITDQIPKPLIPVAGRTLIDRALDWLALSGVSDVVVNSFYKADQLEAHLALRQAQPSSAPRINVIREEAPLETGGGIKNALPLLGSAPFFVVNSDTICVDGEVPALHRLISAWDEQCMDALLLVHPVEQAVGYEGRGDFFVEEGGRLRRRGTASAAPYVFTGVQLLHPQFFSQAPEGAFSMNVLYNQEMLADGTLLRARALIHDGAWLHVGNPQELRQAEQWFATKATATS